MTIEQILADIRSDRVKKVVFDTDTYNEMDDQFALAYALGVDRIKLLAINAAPFFNDRSTSLADGMEKSYDEIGRVLEVTNKVGICPTYKGSDRAISEDPELKPVDSPAARAIIELAHSNTDAILYILATGAITNVTSAILLDPSIKDKICVVWLGSNTFERGSAKEFNLIQDPRAAQILMNCGVPVVLLPALGNPGYGTQELNVKRSELTGIKGSSKACVFFRDTLPNEFGAAEKPDWQRTIWDLAAPGILSVPEAFSLHIIPSPVICDNKRIEIDSTRHKIIYMDKLDRSIVVEDTFKCISKL